MSTDAPKTDTPKPRKARATSYDVYRQDDDGTLDRIAVDVKAPTRREAIVQATAGMQEDRQYGTFCTAKHGGLQDELAVTRNLKARRRLARTATGVGVVFALVSIWPFAFGPTYALGVVCVFVGGLRWIDCNAELTRREGTTRARVRA